MIMGTKHAPNDPPRPSSIPPGAQIFRIGEITDLGRMVRHARKRLKLSIRDVAESTGYSVSFIVDVEHGKPTIEVGRVLELMASLGVDLHAAFR
jgi:ribosome-binding protein aMBF1 (putative translation factor)